MKLKIALIMISIILFSQIALATDVLTEYEGSGDLLMTTTIISPVQPTVQDTVGSHTACSGECCGCCNNCYGTGLGGYDGWSYLTNEYYGFSVDQGSVENGCINLQQDIVEQNGDQTITTQYNTGVNGTGYAYSWLSAVPFNAYAYQYAEGFGSTWAFFGQSSKTDDELNFETIFGGGTIDCNFGNVSMESEYQINSQADYNSILKALCQDPGFAYAALHGKASDYLNSNVELKTKFMNWLMNTEVIGQSELNISATSDNSLDFSFDMVLG
jgi:hypothetical protein